MFTIGKKKSLIFSNKKIMLQCPIIMLLIIKLTQHLKKIDSFIVLTSIFIGQRPGTEGRYSTFQKFD